MQFIDLKQQQARIRDQIQNNINKVLDHGKYIMGPEVYELEERLAEFVGVKHCIGVSSGTDALLIAMMALDIGVGDEIITTPFTFIATGEMIALLGAKLVYVDIDSDTYNIDPQKIESVITSKTKAIIPVNLYGQCADYDSINTVARKYGLAVIEDAAQSFGGEYKGRQSCRLTDIGCASFFPSKPLGCYGDGGACFTNDSNLAQKMKQIRIHGQEKRYFHSRIGINGRLDTIQAAILLAKLEIFPDEVVQRRIVAEKYNNLFKDTTLFKTPFIEKYNRSVYAQYTIKTNDRSNLISKLNEFNIPSAVHYPTPLYKQPALLNDKLNFPICEESSKTVLSLPMHPYLTEESQTEIFECIIS